MNYNIGGYTSYNNYDAASQPIAISAAANPEAPQPILVNVEKSVKPESSQEAPIPIPVYQQPVQQPIMASGTTAIQPTTSEVPWSPMLAFVNESQFYLSMEHPNDCENRRDIAVRPCDYYGQLDTTMQPVFSFVRCVGTTGLYYTEVNNNRYMIQRGFMNQYELHNVTTNTCICKTTYKTQCQGSTFEVRFENTNIRPMNGKLLLINMAPSLQLNEGNGIGVIVPQLGDDCGNSRADALCIPSGKANPTIDPFTMRLIYIYLYISSFFFGGNK